MAEAASRAAAVHQISQILMAGMGGKADTSFRLVAQLVPQGLRARRAPRGPLAVPPP